MTSRNSSKPLELHLAAQRGDLSRVEKILESGAPVDALDDDGRSALHLASLSGSVNVVAALLEYGASPRLADTSGLTPLHFAAREQYVEVVRLLLQAGSVVDAQDENGNTPLSDAVFGYRGVGGSVIALLEAGANPKLENLHGISPAELARSIANYDVRRFFE